MLVRVIFNSLTHQFEVQTKSSWLQWWWSEHGSYIGQKQAIEAAESKLAFEREWKKPRRERETLVWLKEV